MHYQINLPSGLSKDFRKFVYIVPTHDIVVVQYLGNEACAVDYPHGNSKKAVNFLPVAKCLTAQLADKSHKFADVRVKCAQDSEQFQPRNWHQKRYFERKSEVTVDSFLALHESAYMLPGFIWNITTYPDLVVLFGLPEFFVLLDSCASDMVLLSYDTTFNLGDFYVTTLVVQLGSFNEKPIIPVAFMLHERKFQKLHEEFCASIFRHLSRTVTSQQLHVCTDGESGCANAIQQSFPAWVVFTCWNHVIRDVEFWLKKHGATKDELVVYKNQIQNLLSADTDDEYMMTLESHYPTWSQAFCDYYISNLESRVRSSFRGKLREHNFAGDSVTTNNSESMNAVIKRFQDFKEVSVDKMVFSMYRLQLAYGLQLNKSIRGFGPYTTNTTCVLQQLNLPECSEYDDFLRTMDFAVSNNVNADTITDVAKTLQVAHVPNQRCFSVSTATGIVNSVHLFPKDMHLCCGQSMLPHNSLQVIAWHFTQL